jgi:hypothetical protein
MKKGKCEEGVDGNVEWLHRTRNLYLRHQHPNVKRFYIYGLKDGCASCNEIYNVGIK